MNESRRVPVVAASARKLYRVTWDGHPLLKLIAPDSLPLLDADAVSLLFDHWPPGLTAHVETVTVPDDWPEPEIQKVRGYI